MLTISNQLPSPLLATSSATYGAWRHAKNSRVAGCLVSEATIAYKCDAWHYIAEEIYPFNGCGGHGCLKRKWWQNYKIANTDSKCRQPEPETGPPWQIRMQIHKLIIFNSASDNQTYLYAVGQTPEKTGKTKQLSRAESEARRRRASKAVIQTATRVSP